MVSTVRPLVRSRLPLAPVVIAAALFASGCAGRAAAPEPLPPPPPVRTVEAPTVADTTAPPTVRESDYSFTRNEARLAGTLTMPAQLPDPVPVALIIAGSGPTDRDGNNVPVLHTNMYAQLAWELAEHGIASVRYDKRGIGESAMELDPSALTTDDFMYDVIAGATELAQDPQFSRVFLVGHSEGAQLAIQAANRGAPVAGVVMVSGLGRPMPVVLREQVARLLDGPALARFDTALTRFLRGEDPGEVDPAVRPLLLPQHQRFLRSMAEYDAPAELARAQVPILIAHGRRDLQVTMADFDVLTTARPDASTLLLEEANHTLKRTEATTPMGQLSTYRDPTIPIDPDLAPGLVSWVREVWEMTATRGQESSGRQ